MSRFSWYVLWSFVSSVNSSVLVERDGRQTRVITLEVFFTLLCTSASTSPGEIQISLLGGGMCFAGIIGVGICRRSPYLKEGIRNIPVSLCSPIISKATGTCCRREGRSRYMLWCTTTDLRTSWSKSLKSTYIHLSMAM